MSFKGSNSILFDFYSLVDKELSLISFIRSEYRDEELKYLDKHRILYSEENWTNTRTLGSEDAFKSLIIDEDSKSRYREILNSIVENNESLILQNFAKKTDLHSLIAAYKRAGGGFISTAIHCETEAQVEYVKKQYPGTKIEFGKKKDIDTGLYGRLIISNWLDAMEFKYSEPKSILLLNFRENFTEKDSTLLHPELIINLGDIHDIQIISAYRVD